ncbi:MAG: M20/M25/M40 family metallo-hydrolase [Renibacterium salmoninarum]|nr:M20/M25/M40 family metallo-hydrolase [Renibacterium salmoninarum]
MADPDFAIDPAAGDRAAAHLSKLVRFKTVAAWRPDPADPSEAEGQAEFELQIEALREFYPLVHEQLGLERVGRAGLLYRWAGSAAAEPGRPAQRVLVLLAHLDVVPVDPDAPWQQPAFSGVLQDGYLWGRGTLDDKGSAVAILTAVEALLGTGFTPSHDVYLSFGGDEETGGLDALAAMELLRARGVRPWLVLDEGGAVAEQAFPGVARPVAMIGVAEKGSVNVRMSAVDPGGHSSTPPKLTATARLARAISRVSRNPFLPALHQATAQMVQVLAANMSGPQRHLLGRAQQLGWLLARIFPFFGPEANASVRTTAAVTQLSGSRAANVLAEAASATVNVRIAPGSSVAETLRRLRRAVRDPLVEFEVFESSEPSPVSPTDNRQFGLLTAAVRRVFPDAAVAPYIVMAMTDSRRFNEISPAVYRFAPFRMDAAARASLHAANEKISVATLAEGVAFYRALLVLCEQADDGDPA